MSDELSGEGQCARCGEYRRAAVLPIEKIDGDWVVRAVNPCTCGETRLCAFRSDPIRETISRRDVGGLP